MNSRNPKQGESPFIEKPTLIFSWKTQYHRPAMMNLGKVAGNMWQDPQNPT